MEEYFRGAVEERQLVSRFLTIRAARAGHRWSELPWWAVYERLRLKWTITVLATTAVAIERGEHCEEQAKWVAEIDRGDAIANGIRAAMDELAAQVDDAPKPEGEAA